MLGRTQYRRVGFERSLRSFLTGVQVPQALILGTGGAAKAVAFVLEGMGISHRFVSRKPNPHQLNYAQLGELIQDYRLIINTTPLGVKGNEGSCPDLPYKQLGTQHLLYDLNYNPAQTLFLKKGVERGAVTKNGLEMLQIQADEAWKLWREVAV